MSDKQFNIAIVGLGFGAEFIPIHQAHPNANLIAHGRARGPLFSPLL